ncbi:ead/Ea22-like family protein [Salmonella enterica subsp. enterica serovar Bredeney]|uniref:ead/Ea22-like family protein n=1 Tax=Salmonella enterica TaxID=28901 RepID=UPI000FA7AD31|nr:ead/Ea22-like family protein [Salmonella enterica subsp. enterica serovar Bredeney]
MSNIDKQALRQAAEKATPGNWRRASSRFNGITVTPFSLCDEEVMLAHAVEKRDAEFIVAANPATVLALLDENLQLQREKDAIEAVALALRDDMRQAREQLEAAERRMAEQSAIVAAAEKLVRCKGRYHSELNYRALAKLFGVVTPDLPPLEHENVHYADAAEVEITALRQRIAELEARAVNLPKRSVDEVMHLSGFSRDYAEGWCAGNDNAIHEIRTAGIKVKGE